jgi:glucose-6-phosphate isomerase
MVAVSANVKGAAEFGIPSERVFGFWDWVGGRYSVCSAVGVMPLALQYGFPMVQRFLEGAASVDEHFLTAPWQKNLPVLLGLLGVWNSTFMGHATRALLPYSQALLRFPAHIQQVDMESNGKRVATDGTTLPFDAGEIDFGEPGTNGQHSFYQLIHQGRTIPCDFIGFCESQTPMGSPDEKVENHDELMSNFFAQPDALAFGLAHEDPHRHFPGNRPSSSLLLPRLDAYTAGQLLALYEHRTAVQGFVWGIASFDQWGVQLGKKLAKSVREQLHASRKPDAKPVSGEFTASTAALLKRFVAHKPHARL